jgi:hypothetical protein
MVRFVGLIVVALAAIIIPNGRAAEASGNNAQLRLVVYTCNTVVVGSLKQIERTDECYLHRSWGISQIEGYNQNGDWVTWRAEEHPCEQDGNNVRFVRGWWWNFERDVYLTAEGRRFLLPKFTPGRYQWANFGIVYQKYYYVGGGDPEVVFKLTDR